MRNCHFDLAKGCAATYKINKAKKNSFLQYLFFYMSLFLVQFGEGQSNNSHKEHQKPNLFVSNPDRSKKVPAIPLVIQILHMREAISIHEVN